MIGTSNIGLDPVTGMVSRYTPPSVTVGLGNPSAPQISVPSVGQAIAANAVIPAGHWVFVNEANGAATYVVGNGTATANATGFLFAAA